MEETNKFVARLEKFNEKVFPERYYDILDMIYAYKKLNEDDEKVNVHLTALEKIFNDAREDKRSFVEKRFNFWKSLLYDFYHIKVISEDNSKILYEFYFYPYEIVKENSMLFGLYSEKKSSEHFYISKCGVEEVAFNIFRDLSFPMEIEYSSEEEMLKNAAETSKELIDIRMWKLKYRDKLI